MVPIQEYQCEKGCYKLCFDGLNDSKDDIQWKIDSLCADSKALSLNFLSVAFYWIKREANFILHDLTKFAAHHNLILSNCDKTLLFLSLSLPVC